MNLPSSKQFIDHLITELSTFKSSSTTTTTSSTQPESRTQPQPPQNSLTKLPTQDLNKVKPIILTLHCLFPNDFLPALDILDRHLVQRLETNNLPINQTRTNVPDENHATNADAYETIQTLTPDQIKDNHKSRRRYKGLFLVTSASSVPVPVPVPVPRQKIPTTSNSGPTQDNQDPSKAYEVRLQAWNCTCPTFTLSIFKNPDSNPDLPSFWENDFAQLQARGEERKVKLDAEGETDTDADAEGDYPFGGTLVCDTDRGSPGICKHILACVLFARCPGLFGGGNEDGRLGVSLEEIAGWCAGWGG